MVIGAFSSSEFADAKSRDKLFQLRDTTLAIDATIRAIAKLPTDHNQHLRSFMKDVDKEMSDIVVDMAVALGKRDNSTIDSPLKRLRARRDIDKLQNRLDMLQCKIPDEFSEAYEETYQ
jgi:hypothetical protein